MICKLVLQTSLKEGSLPHSVFVFSISALFNGCSRK